METRNRVVRVSVRTGHFRAEGVLEVPENGYRGRVLDYLNGGADFFALTDVLLWETGEETTEEPIAHDVILLRKRATDFAVPLSDRH